MTTRTHGRAGSHGHHGDDDDDFGIFGGMDHGRWMHNIGLGLPLPAFIKLVDAILAHDPPTIAAGENGASSATSNLFWTYAPRQGLHVEAAAGFLTTATGNGGFSLVVRPDGSWRLSFSGSDTVIGHADCDTDGSAAPPPPPATNEHVTLGAGATSYDASRGHVTVDGGAGWDTIQGGVGDYMIGGSGTLGGGQAGQGNCALYSKSPGSVLVDAENGFGYGGSAEGNVLVNINQVRGSLFSNVLIGSSSGTDLKSCGGNSLLISTGGDGFEMRPDGAGNVLVSTVGNDWIVFDPSKGWHLGDDNVLLGFDGRPGHDFIDLRMLMSASGPLHASYWTAAAVGYDPATGHGDINAYVAIQDQADGSHLLLSPAGDVQSAGTEILSLRFTHGLDVAAMLGSGALRV